MNCNISLILLLKNLQHFLKYLPIHGMTMSYHHMNTKFLGYSVTFSCISLIFCEVMSWSFLGRMADSLFMCELVKESENSKMWTLSKERSCLEVHKQNNRILEVSTKTGSTERQAKHSFCCTIPRYRERSQKLLLKGKPAVRYRPERELIVKT